METFIHYAKRVLGTIGLSVLLAAVGGGCAPSSNPAPTATEPPTITLETPIDVKLWLTTADQSRLLAPQPDLSFGRGAASGTAIYVNENHRYQTMDGFGAAMTDSSAWLIYTQLSEKQRSGLMTALFSRSDGIGIGVLRLPMGASDFVVGDHYSYDDMPPGQADPQLAHFSIEHDKAYIIPALKEALRINPDLKIIASPWSPPGWMKDSDSLLDGTLQKQYYGAFANYFVKFIQAYQAERIPIYAVTLQNEPHYEPHFYPGMRLEPADEAEVVKNYLGPAFSTSGIHTKILVWDHNWDEWEYPVEVLNDPQAKQYIAGSAFHCYAGSVLSQGLVHDAYPDRDIFFTECSSGVVSYTFSGGLKRDMQDLIMGAVRNWAKTVIKWNLALDTSYGPHMGGCGNCMGTVTIDPKLESGYVPNAEFYSLGHAGKFVLPGAYRIASTTFPYGSPETVAFMNPDGSKVFIAYNPGTADQPIAVVWGDRSFAYTLPGESIATFVWKGTQRNSLPPTPPEYPSARLFAGKVVVQWDFSPQADTYAVKRADQAGGSYTVVATGIGIPEYFDTNIETGKTYYYVVRAFNEFGESKDSVEAATTQTE